MPECKFGMNDKLLMEKESNNNKIDRGINISDLKFHQCVRLGKFDKDRSITFIPPDGTFDLMTFNLTYLVIELRITLIYLLKLCRFLMKWQGLSMENKKLNALSS